MPSEWYENCPLSLLESLALGRPVIGSRIGGIPELIEEGSDGLLVPPGDAEALAEAIGRLTRAPERAAAMGRAGRRKVETSFDKAGHYAKVRAIYARLAP